ncbi:HAD family hydrolase [Flavivirga algicola]|uniref:HAD family hydrolase n=1 Tax=Flavivirga algicola TaxID=2729136 RepID=A0ABX1RZE5_9FLAO|nr:HAD family hydrolase [Flavivirga algicola]NMH88168.1 HAD family hydrolase [Flavivirga algicola]
MIIKDNKIVIFDLDDTLYNEIDFLKSAYKEIAEEIANDINADALSIYREMLICFDNKNNVFETIIKKYGVSYDTQELLHIYRNHVPELKLSKDRQDTLNKLKHSNISMGILTDGRSLQQRNKIKALQLDIWFSEIVISEEFGSEKPNSNNYTHFEKVFGKGQYYYVGDNINKDFITPNKLDWVTICLADNGLNIHKPNNVSLMNNEYLAKYTITSFIDILKVIDK